LYNSNVNNIDSIADTLESIMTKFDNLYLDSNGFNVSKKELRDWKKTKLDIPNIRHNIQIRELYVHLIIWNND
jgi:hypothetical protein